MPKAFEAALAQAKKDRVPVMALRHDSQGLDDVVVEIPTLFRAEMMSSDYLWMCCYFANGERVTFSVSAVRDKPRGKPKLEFSVGEEPPKWLDWDEMRGDA